MAFFDLFIKNQSLTQGWLFDLWTFCTIDQLGSTLYHICDMFQASFHVHAISIPHFGPKIQNWQIVHLASKSKTSTACKGRPQTAIGKPFLQLVAGPNRGKHTPSICNAHNWNFGKWSHITKTKWAIHVKTSNNICKSLFAALRPKNVQHLHLHLLICFQH